MLSSKAYNLLAGRLISRTFSITNSSSTFSLAIPHPLYISPIRVSSVLPYKFLILLCRSGTYSKRAKKWTLGRNNTEFADMMKEIKTEITAKNNRYLSCSRACDKGKLFLNYWLILISMILLTSFIELDICCSYVINLISSMLTGLSRSKPRLNNRNPGFNFIIKKTNE